MPPDRGVRVAPGALLLGHERRGHDSAWEPCPTHVDLHRGADLDGGRKKREGNAVLEHRREVAGRDDADRLTVDENVTVGPRWTSTLDSDARQADYNKVAEWMAATLPIVPMYTVNQMHGVSAKLGWQPTPAESMFINRMTWTE